MEFKKNVCSLKIRKQKDQMALKMAKKASLNHKNSRNGRFLVSESEKSEKIAF